MPNKVEPELNDLATYCVKHNLFDIYAQYDRKKNSIPINQIAAKSSKKKVWWCCPQGHSYQATPSNRIRQHSGCPYCSGQKVLTGFNDLKTLFPQLATEFDQSRNHIAPEFVNAGTPKKYWWICPKCKNSYYSSVVKRTSLSRGCPYCAHQKLQKGYNDLVTWCNQHNREDILRDWDYSKNKIDPSEVLGGGKKKFWFICPKCGKQYQASLSHKLSSIPTMCPYCSGTKSTIELAIYNLIKQFVDEETVSGKKFFKKEIDIYSPKFNLYLEYDGVYYHNNDGQLGKQEIEKNNIFAQNKIKIIRIKETRDKSKNLLKESSEFLDIYYIYKNYNKQFWESLSEILKQICEIKISPEEIKNIYLSIKQRKNS